MKTFNKAEILPNTTTPFVTIMTPEGFQAFKTEITGITFFKDSGENATFTANTGYGASYVAQVQNGANRIGEYCASIVLKTGGEFCVWFTSKTTPTQAQAKALFDKAFYTLPKRSQDIIRKKSGKNKVEVIKARCELGLV